MSEKTENRVALITGAARGIGATIALALAAEFDFRRNLVQTPRFIARYGVLKLLIARRCVVEIADGFKERIRGEAANLPLEASKRLAGKLE